MGTRWQRSNYRLILAVPGMRVLAIASLLGRLAFAMTNLSLLLFVADATGEIDVAGAAAGMGLLGTALSATIQGRWFDRHGVRTVLLRLAALYTSLTVALVAVITTHAQVWIMLLLILIQSMAMPMMGVASRSMLPRLAPEGPQRDDLIRYWTISFEVCYVAAPALVALLTLGELTAKVPFVLAAICLVATSVTYATSPLVQKAAEPSPDDPTVTARGGVAGLGTLIIAAAGFGAGVGFVVITVTAIAKSIGNPEMVGLPFSLMTAFSVLGGLLFSRHQTSWPQYRQLALLMAFSAVALLIPTFFGGNTVPEIVLCCVVAGISFAPQLILQSTILEEICPPHRVGVSFGWLTTAVTVGNAAAQTAGGALSDWYSTGVAAGTGAILLAAMAVVVGLRGGRVVPAAPQWSAQ